MFSFFKIGVHFECHIFKGRSKGIRSVYRVSAVIVDQNQNCRLKTILFIYFYFIKAFTNL